MGNERKIKAITTIFSILMKTAIAPAFTFPKGGIATQAVSSCLELLEEKYQGQVSNERIVDFCICQVHAISRFEKGYYAKWKVTHSFGKKAIERFKGNKQVIKYYEYKWLKEYKLSREALLMEIQDRSEHPLAAYIFTQHEEGTKKRVLSTPVGYYICGISTLLYTPFSLSCQNCRNAKKCIERTIKNFPELYRIRMEKYNCRKQ